MLYGQIKVADFFDDHQNAIFGGLRGAATGGVVGLVQDIEKDKWEKSRLRNGAEGAIVGGILGGGIGTIIDHNRDVIREASNKGNELWHRVSDPIFEILDK
jgi:hypothetical protein